MIGLPTCQSDSSAEPPQYCSVNSLLVSARHSASGVVAGHVQAVAELTQRLPVLLEQSIEDQPSAGICECFEHGVQLACHGRILGNQ